MKSPVVSVVILNLNGIKYLEACLSSVFRTRYPNLEVILVDNASADGSPELASSLFGNRGDFKLIRSTTNIGISGGYNLGARNSTGEYIIFLNNDTVVEADWVTGLVDSFSTDRSLGAAQSKILMLEDPSAIDCTGGFLDPLGLPWERGLGERDAGQYDNRDEISYAKGAAMMVPRIVFFGVGGFDDSYISYFEDTDISWRIWLHGFRVAFAPESRVYHAGGGTMRLAPRTSVYYRYRRNQLLTLMKNYGDVNVIKYLGFAMLVDLRNLLVIMLSKFIGRRAQHISSFSLIRAYAWLLRNLRPTLGKRAFVQKRVRRVSDSYMIGRAMRSIYSAPRLLLYGQAKAQVVKPD
jgi:GT2 family glycosyltransferase